MSNPLTKYFQDNPNMTTEDLAHLTDIPFHTMSNIRNGRKTIPNVLEALAIQDATNGEVPVTAWEE